MSSADNDKIYKRLLGILRMIADNGAGAAEERDNALRLFSTTWQKNQLTLPEFIEWLVADESFVDNLRQVNHVGIKDLLIKSAAALQAALPEDEAVKSYSTGVNAHFLQEEQTAKTDAKRQILLDIVILQKDASKFKAAGQSSSAESFGDEAQAIITKHGITQLELDAFHLEREQTILDLYRKVDLWDKIRDPQRKQELEDGIKATANIWGLLKDNGGTLDYSPEFMETYLGSYNEDREKYAASIKDLEKSFTAKHKGQTPPSQPDAAANAADDTDADDATSAGSPEPQAPAKPTRVTVFPLRDFKGDVSAYIGGQTYHEAVEKLAQNAGDVFSLSQDFPLDDMIISGKKKIEVRQQGAVTGWQLSANEIAWRMENPDPNAPIINSAFNAQSADIELSVSQGIKITVGENGKITVRGASQNATIELKKKGALLINNRFEDSSFTANSSGVSIEFEGDEAHALRSKFVGRLPSVSKLSAGALRKEHTKAKAGQILAAIEDSMKAVFGLGGAGYNDNRWSPSYYRPHFTTLSQSEFAVLNYFMTALATGYSGIHIRDASSRSLVEKFTGAKWGSEWQQFYTKAKADGQRLSLLVQPLLPNAEDFNTDSEAPKGEYNYRVTFIAGRIDTDYLGEKLSTDLTKRKQDSGHPSGFFSALNKYLCEDERKIFSIDITTDTSDNYLRSAKASGVDPFGSLMHVYQGLKSSGGVSDFLNNTNLFWHNYSVEDGKISRGYNRGTHSVFRYSDENNFCRRPQQECYKKAVKDLSELIPNQSSVILNGKYFEDCTFTGDFDGAILESLSGNHFIKLNGKKLTVSGDWNLSDFADCKISAVTTEDVNLDDTVFSSTELALVGDADSVIVMNEIKSTDSTLDFKNYRHVSSKNSTCKGKKIIFRDIKELDLQGSTFQDCELHLEDIGGIEAQGAKFTNCKIAVIGNSHLNDRTVNLTGIEITNSTLNINGHLLNLTNAIISGVSTIQGKLASVIGTAAQLGSGIESSDITTWQLETHAMDVTELKIGNLSIQNAKAFGVAHNDDAWQTASVIGVPSMMPDARTLFDKLKLTRNYIAEHRPLATDTGAVAAKEFRL